GAVAPAAVAAAGAGSGAATGAARGGDLMRSPATIDAGAAVLRATEAQFQRTIIQAGQWHGWQWYHTQFSLGSRAGFPDLVGFNPRLGGVLFAEVKSERGRV